MRYSILILLLFVGSCQIAQTPVKTYKPQLSYHDAMAKNLPEPSRTEKALSKVFVASIIVLFVSAF